MSMTFREVVAAIHGVLGFVFLLAFAGGMVGLWGLRPEYATLAGTRALVRRLIAGTWVMALAVWATLILGTWIVYPWYRATPPKGANLADYPRSYLQSQPNLVGWQTFGMEFKEHIPWFAGPLATAAAFIVLRYGTHLVHDSQVRRATMALLSGTFVIVGVAGALGALITKAAPIH